MLPPRLPSADARRNSARRRHQHIHIQHGYDTWVRQTPFQTPSKTRQPHLSDFNTDSLSLSLSLSHSPSVSVFNAYRSLLRVTRRSSRLALPALSRCLGATGSTNRSDSRIGGGAASRPLRSLLRDFMRLLRPTGLALRERRRRLCEMKKTGNSFGVEGRNRQLISTAVSWEGTASHRQTWPEEGVSVVYDRQKECQAGDREAAGGCTTETPCPKGKGAAAPCLEELHSLESTLIGLGWSGGLNGKATAVGGRF